MMLKKRIYGGFVFFSALLMLAACHRAVIKVEDIPDNTPKGQPLYVAGNFNNWDPGDEAYRMTLNSDSSYTFRLPPGFGSVEYKITRGDWTTVETDVCGYNIENRMLVLGEEDTTSIIIDSWHDLDPLNCPTLTLVLKKVPKNTPADEPICLAGNFNSWNPDPSTTLQKDSTGKYFITINRPTNIKDVEFKITRGDLSKSEADQFGNTRPNRMISFEGKDTIELEVEGWVDLPSPDAKSNVVEIICTRIPGNTPPGDRIILVSNLNNWNPNDKNYLLKKDSQGRYSFSIPKRDYIMEFKFTRGGWHSVETDPYGFDISNRVVDLKNTDTLFVKIAGWKDLPGPRDREVTIILQKVPAQTPPDDKIYLAGNFNNWNPGREKFRFQNYKDGQYILNIPRENHSMEFKVTRGNRNTFEVDNFGSDIPNRNYRYSEYDTLYIEVVNWKDKPIFKQDRVTIVVDKLPENTPPSSRLYITGTFNDWNPGDRDMVFKKLPNGKPYITLPLNEKYIEYKITRGGWNSCEVNQEGWEIPNRGLTLGFADTVYISIERWQDRF